MQWVKPATFVSLMLCGIAAAHAAESPPQCQLQPVFHKNGTASFDGVLYADRARLKARLLAYHKQNPNCIMLNFVLESGTSQKVMAEALSLIIEAGFAPPKVGFLIEPRETPP